VGKTTKKKKGHPAQVEDELVADDDFEHEQKGLASNEGLEKDQVSSFGLNDGN